MKKSLVVLLILVLVAGVAFAAVEPQFSGEFKFGYKFAFGNDETKIGRNWSPNELKLKLQFGTDVWALKVKTVGSSFDSGSKFGANLTFNIDKMTDMGDHKLALNMGANDRMTAFSAYDDIANGDDGYWKFKNNGQVTTGITYGFADLFKVQAIIDPTNENGKKASFMVSAQGNLVDGAVVVAAQYGFRPVVYTFGINRVANIVSDYVGGSKVEPKETQLYAYQGFGGSASVDIAKLVGMDVALKVSVVDNWATGFNEGWLESEGEKRYLNSLAAAVQTGVDALNGYVEFSAETETDKTGSKDDSTTWCNLAVGLKTGAIENLPIEVFFQLNDLGDKIDCNSFKIGAEAFYKYFGVNVAYSKFKSEDNGVFVVTPQMKLSF